MSLELKTTLEQFGPVRTALPLAQLTTFNIGGPADYVVYPQNELALAQCLKFLKEKGISTKLLGNGSNILANDKPYHGVIIKLDRFFNSVFFDDLDVTVQAGHSLIALAYLAYQHGLSGLEFASGIPGSVGGAVFMNAGAYLCSLFKLIRRIYVFRNGDFEWIDVREINYAYRYSSFMDHPDWIIVAVELRLNHGDKAEIKALMDQRQSRRMSSQPLQFPSAGSVFRNPIQAPAWQLIQDAHLRGLRIGDAMISEQHANFIINLGQAKASDVYELIEQARKTVADKYQIELKPEIEFFNW